ncbi:hypothetical protein HNQ69_001600 [Bartonella callosciuri]|uniref:Uncharacterized protein n=1 Tax=Bartonella callosciuri TaxID=686223 RepID=A0A840P2F0_9HYPH|nr:hypothetical protein [Bartonella callosciuri]
MVTGHRLCFLGELGGGGYWTPSLLLGVVLGVYDYLDTVFAFGAVLVRWLLVYKNLCIQKS